MEIDRLDEAIALSKLDVFFVELLKQIPDSADPQGSEAARERLFSKPSKDAKTNEDWKAYVEPGIRQLFQSALETVKEDLKSIVPNGGKGGTEFKLRIPVAHLEAWLNGLNQARLVIAARHGFTDGEMELDRPSSLDTVRDVELFQIQFYGFLQECFLRELS